MRDLRSLHLHVSKLIVSHTAILHAEFSGASLSNGTARPGEFTTFHISVYDCPVAVDSKSWTNQVVSGVQNHDDTDGLILYSG